jgi:hypothetical protein
MQTYNYIELAIMFVRSSGPVTRDQIAAEIRNQSVTAARHTALADRAIAHGLSRGWLEQYDDESYCMA